MNSRTPLNIGLVLPDDNPQLASLIRCVMTEFGAVGDGFSIEDPEVDSMYEAYQGEKRIYYAIRKGDKIVGCGGLAELIGGAPDICELRKMYFLAEARGHGMGRRLAETLISDARRMGYRRMYIETLERMERANQMYVKLGFKEIPASLGKTGHCGCDRFYTLDL